MPAILRVLLGVDDAYKMTFTSGIPDSIETLKEEIKRRFGLVEDFRLQYMDVDFNAFVNLTTTTDIEDKSTIKVIYMRNNDLTSTASPASSAPTEPPLDSSSASDTDILSSPGSSSSCSTLRLNSWPKNFPIPAFSFDVQFQLDRAQQDFLDNGTLLDPSPKLKSDILETLASEIVNYKVYPSNGDIDDVAEALIRKYPCLKESGSVTGCAGWKVSLKYKMANYRTLLRNIGCPEVTINAIKNKRNPEEKARNQVKKPRKAEVNFLPQYPTGQTKESLEDQRKMLLEELKKKNNEQIIKMMMDQTFAHRRREVIEEMPFIAEFKNRWPALFTANEINTEFTRITTIPLLSTFMGSLDKYSDQLMKTLRKRGGEKKQQINSVMSPIAKSSRIEVKRECILKALVIYMNESPQALIKEYLDVSILEAEDLGQIDMGIYKIIHEGADPDDCPEEVGVIIEGCTVLEELGDAATGSALLFGLIYCLNLSYPKTLRYTFEFIQKVLMGLEDKKLSNKVQVLKNKLDVSN